MILEKIQERTLMLRSSPLLNETTELWSDTTVLWLEKHKNTQNTQRKRERSSEAAIVGAIMVFIAIKQAGVFLQNSNFISRPTPSVDGLCETCGSANKVALFFLQVILQSSTH
ncbi:hypothetical protein ILYODFUR_035234 [Ilyodon furcidens]|uniref:Uncharacterized protein n=1 Tax=Ilyodon furcidens TaxID=33524 RepID=A0ABV0V0I1_9TELE